MLPEKWFIRGSDMLSEWQRKEMGDECNCTLKYSEYRYTNDGDIVNGWDYYDEHCHVPESYKEITFEQFEKYILNKDNMKTEVKIVAPEGYEIDKENSTFECVKFKKRENTLPKTWEELGSVKGYIIRNSSDITQVSDRDTSPIYRAVYPTKELAEAALALAQLLQLREVYNDGWQPDWSDSSYIKCVINNIGGEINPNFYYNTPFILSFKSEELRDEFLKNFRDLIEIAKPLL